MLIKHVGNFAWLNVVFQRGWLTPVNNVTEPLALVSVCFAGRLYPQGMQHFLSLLCQDYWEDLTRMLLPPRSIQRNVSACFACLVCTMFVCVCQSFFLDWGSADYQSHFDLSADRLHTNILRYSWLQQFSLQVCAGGQKSNYEIHSSISLLMCWFCSSIYTRINRINHTFDVLRFNESYTPKASGKTPDLLSKSSTFWCTFFKKTA